MTTIEQLRAEAVSHYYEEPYVSRRLDAFRQADAQSEALALSRTGSPTPAKELILKLIQRAGYSEFGASLLLGMFINETRWVNPHDALVMGVLGVVCSGEHPTACEDLSPSGIVQGWSSIETQEDTKAVVADLSAAVKTYEETGSIPEVQRTLQ